MSITVLPQQNHFTLEQIGKRWNCSEEELLQYCRTKMLEIGVMLNGVEASFIAADNEKCSIELSGFYLLAINDVEAIHNDGHRSLLKCFFYVERSSDRDSPDKIKFNHEYMVTSSQLVVHRNERDAFEATHNMDIDKSIIKNQSILGEQKKRELILKGWLVGKGLNIEKPLEQTRKQVWSAISQADKSLFRTDGDSTIKTFFDNAKICSFKLGRRKG